MSDFVVNDRRLFGQDGQPRPETEDGGETPAGAAGAVHENVAAGPAPGENASLPPANLASLLIGLATSAFMHLGETPPEGAEAPGRADLPAARHTIDLLAVLQKKTQGNLEPEEEALLTTLLYDLRLKYVQVSKK